MANGYAYEKLGLFYLGREMHKDGRSDVTLPLLLKSKTLTTHAAIVGMTGSGKTGLGIGLIEEAVMDNIPSIIIDPKGDMANLLLTFPDLRPEDFEPWIDSAEAEKKGMTVEAFAQEKAETWKEGLRSWDQDEQRIAMLREKTTFTLYTPGSTAGIPVSILQSFAPPSDDIMRDGSTLNDLVDAVVSSLLSLADINTDSNTSREYVLLSGLFLDSWRKKEQLNMEGLIGAIVNPPFEKIGVFALDTFFPQPERMQLAMALNGVIASPAYAAWTQGAPLDIQKILYGDDGKPRTAIFSIAHLEDTERMFFVTMLLNRIVDWMRRQQGTASLKAILYMDEIFGFFPPSANPPSKKPMLLLLKQARAYGVGVVLATQNPVDLDYKGLSNIGTWFVGRLQTSQDQNRLLDGLVGSGGDTTDKGALREIIGGLQGRQFLLRSVHLDELLLFETRWVMSYLKGPISLADIDTLMKRQKEGVQQDLEPDTVSVDYMNISGSVLNHPPLIADTIKQCFFLHPMAVEEYLFQPWLAARGKVRFYDRKRNIDEVTEVSLRLYIDERLTDPQWEEGEINPCSVENLDDRPPLEASFYPLPASFSSMRDFRGYSKSFADYLYHNKKLELYMVADIGLESIPGESQADFKVRLADSLRDLKETEVEKLEDKFRAKQQRIEDRLERAVQKVEKEKGDVAAKTTDTILSFGTAILAAVFGRKSISISSMSRATTGVKNVGRLAREKGDVKRAEEEVVKLEKEIDLLAAELEEETSLLTEKFAVDNYAIETFAINPRRNDIFDIDLCLLWEMVLPQQVMEGER